MSVACAESCTGDLLASLLTGQDGLGHCFDRGFVTYTDEAKPDMRLIREDIFGPVGSVIPFDDEEEVVAEAQFEGLEAYLNTKSVYAGL